MTASEQLLAQSRQLVKQTDAARRSSLLAIAESRALVIAAHSMRRTSRQLRDRSLDRAARTPNARLK